MNKPQEKRIIIQAALRYGLVSRDQHYVRNSFLLTARQMRELKAKISEFEGKAETLSAMLRDRVTPQLSSFESPKV